MAKKRYKFNPQTLTYEVITIPFRIKFYRALRKVLIGFILASIVNVLFSFFFYTPNMYRISRDNNELLIKYNMLNDKLRAALVFFCFITSCLLWKWHNRLPSAIITS